VLDLEEWGEKFIKDKNLQIFNCRDKENYIASIKTFQKAGFKEGSFAYIFKSVKN